MRAGRALKTRAWVTAWMAAGLWGAAVLVEWVAPTPVGRFVVQVFVLTGALSLVDAVMAGWKLKRRQRSISDPVDDGTAGDEAKR